MYRYPDFTSQPTIFRQEKKIPSKTYVDQSFELAETIIGKNSKSFAFASKYLDEDTKKSVVALYAFCRMVDDIVDETQLSSFTKQEILDNISSTIDQLYHGDITDDPILLVFGITIRKHSIPRYLIHELIEGMKMDIVRQRYQTFDDLYLYAYRVASTVGLMMTYIFLNNPSVEVLKRAESLGIAMQLTNILRDVKEDYLRDRVYIPDEWLAKWNVKPSQFDGNDTGVAFSKLLKYMISVARLYYQEGYRGVEDLPSGPDFVVELSGKIYEGILDEIERNKYQIFRKRQFVSKFRKIMIALKLRIKYLNCPSQLKPLNVTYVKKVMK